MGQPFPGSREIIREALLRGQAPQAALDICLNSIIVSTLKQYTVGLNFWWKFCSAKHIDPLQIRVPDVLAFLSDQFTNGASYGTLNSQRSAIAQIAGPALGQDFRIKKFFKGVFGRRPPLPRYENTWDPQLVLDHVRDFDNNSITLGSLTQKLAVLLALATGQRIQTLSRINIQNILTYSDRIEIRISSRTKTSALQKAHPLLVLPFLSNDPKICVARTLLTYLERTEKLRGSCQILFITFKKPYHQASSQSISRWIKIILQHSGININIFKPQSTRHAATSSAARAGVSFDTIRLAADWSKNSQTFAKFYNRPVIDTQEFAQTVLGSKNSEA